MAQQDRSFIGEGIVYARRYQTNDPLIDIGNCDTFNIGFTSDRQTLPNFRGGGGNRNVRERITDVTATIGMYDLTPDNIARVTRSTIAQVAAASVVGEVLRVGGVAGELVPFAKLPDTSQAVTITRAGALTASSEAALGNVGNGTLNSLSVTTAGVGAYNVGLTSATEFAVTGPGSTAVGTGEVGTPFNAGGLAFTLTAGSTAFAADDAFTITVAQGAGAAAEQGVDYQLTPHGIIIPAGSAITTAGAAASYTSLKAGVIHMLAGSQVELEIYIAGLNDAQTGEPYSLRARRVKMGVISELAALGQEYLRLEASAELLADPLVTEAGISKFCEMAVVNKAA